jgi:hypothetical protein
MRTFNKIVIALFLTAVLFTTGCNSIFKNLTKTDLAFKIVADTGGNGGGDIDNSPQIRLLADTKSASAISEMVLDSDMEILNKVDYNRYFTIVVFITFNDYFYPIQIQRIWQDGNVIFIQAPVHDLGPQEYYLCWSSTEYQAVQLDRSILPKSGTIIFKLIDEHGAERAATIVTVVNK